MGYRKTSDDGSRVNHVTLKLITIITRATSHPEAVLALAFNYLLNGSVDGTDEWRVHLQYSPPAAQCGHCIET
jgi:hypothetical protein